MKQVPFSTSLLPLYSSQPQPKLEKRTLGDTNKPYKPCPKEGQS